MSNTKKLLWAGSKETAWESLTLKNNYMFFKVMQEESKLKELLHRVFPEIRIKSLAVVGEKTIQPGEDIHGVRLDIFAQDENGRAFTVEMQVCNQDHLPRRMRYYSSTVDSQLLEKGERFASLPDSYVVLICCFDLFGFGLHKYSFSNKCDQVDGLEMGDGVKYVILSTKATANDGVDIGLKNFLDYVEGGVPVKGDEFIEGLHKSVTRARADKKWRAEYMTIEQHDMEMQYIGEKRGLETKLISQVRRKMQKGLSPDEIAEDIMEDLDYVSTLMAAINTCGPTAEDVDVYRYLHPDSY
ncbi:MAG: Rpn family recombination-promoting nuclease/putative transposase [Eubacterium sp.]|nr:Rpn family recombination-promoting nuclease/putative transposase [Eubacterium sp.]